MAPKVWVVEVVEASGLAITQQLNTRIRRLLAWRAI
jgi:hypothetical protein